MSIKISSILLLIIFIVNVLGLQNLNTTEWKDIKKQLFKYHNSLLNDEIVTDLKQCYKENITEPNIFSVCSVYFDLVLQINKTELNITITPELIKNEWEKPTNNRTIDTFCNRVTHSIPDNKLFTDYEMCRFSCIDFLKELNEIHYKKILKPVCKIINFMTILIANNTATEHNHRIPVDKKIGELIQTENISQQPEQNFNNQNEAEQLQVNKKEITTKENPLKNDELKTKLQIPEKTVTQSIKINDNKSISNQPNIVPPKSSNIQKVAPPPEKKVEIKENASPINSSPINTNNQINEETNLDINNGNDDNEVMLNYDEDNKLYGEDDKLKGSVQSPIQNNKAININTDVKLQPNPEPKLDKLDDVKNDNNKIILNDPFYEKSGSNFFTYLLIAMFGCIILYVAYHNKTKILALLLEGRRGQKGRGGRRKHTAAYRKLDSNLEEAISSPSSARSSQIIY